MPDMPSAFYLPAFTALLAALGVIWRYALEKDAKLTATSETAVTALLKASIALEANTDSVRELKNELAQLALAPEKRGPIRKSETRGGESR